MTRTKFLPWIPNNHQKGIRPNVSLITKRKGKSSSSDCKVVPKDRLKCPNAFRGRQRMLPSLCSFPPGGLFQKAYDTATCPTHCSHQRLSCQRRTAWQDISYYFLLIAETKFHPDLQSSVAWKTKSRVKSKFSVPSRWHWLNWRFVPPTPKNACRKPRVLLAKSSKSRGKNQPAICFPV